MHTLFDFSPNISEISQAISGTFQPIQGMFALGIDFDAFLMVIPNKVQNVDIF